MVVDFKALKLAASEFVDRFDHAMAVNSQDPLRADIERIYPGSTIVFDNTDPSTEVLAKYIFDFIAKLLDEGFQAQAGSGANYMIPAGQVTLERVRVSETPNSWAEYGI